MRRRVVQSLFGVALLMVAAYPAAGQDRGDRMAENAPALTPTLAVFKLDIWIPDGRVVSVSLVEGGTLRLTREGHGRYQISHEPSVGPGVMEVRFWPAEGGFPLFEQIDLSSGRAAELTVDPGVEVELVSVSSAARRQDYGRTMPILASLTPRIPDECCETCNGVTACGCSVQFLEPPSCTDVCCETPECPLETCGTNELVGAPGSKYRFQNSFTCKMVRWAEPTVEHRPSERK